LKLRILITGGNGTIGKAFIDHYSDEFTFVNVSRSLSSAVNYSGESVTHYSCDILDLETLTAIFLKEKPNIVIHTAAVKHVNIAEENPSKAIETNLVGSLNVIKASKVANVEVTIGVSTDKASSPENVYGYSKKMMEQIFLEHHSEKNKFVCVRLANVAGSSGSVIPIWTKLAREQKSLKLTDSRMNRLMLTTMEASDLLHQAYLFSSGSESSFILTKVLKAVSMASLAKSISNHFNGGRSKVEIMGLRPGEKLNETLISEKELSQAYLTKDKKYIMLYNDDYGKERLTRPLSSLTAELMSNAEIEFLYKEKNDE